MTTPVRAALIASSPLQSLVEDEISTVIKKRKAAIQQLRDHLKPGSSVAQWFWVASGKVDFVPIEKATLQLAQNGITFVGKTLHKKHLPSASALKPRTKSRR